MSDWYTDYSLETGPEIVCLHCNGDVVWVEMLERHYELQHVDTANELSADGSHRAEETGI
jgi:hypothetical protein